MKPIYTPKGKAKEYCDYALNIYTGCNHRCFYCFSPLVLHKDREEFHSHVEPRKNIVAETAKQIKSDGITGRLINLCFSCDPYPTGYDTTPTREIIKLLKDSGNNVQILTKGHGRRDFDLLDENDWYGITYAGYENMLLWPKEEPNAQAPAVRIWSIQEAHERGIRTWISFEPVLREEDVLRVLVATRGYVDKVKIGKLNYYKSDIDWARFGRDAERICQEYGIDYYIKESLREEMEKVK